MPSIPSRKKTGASKASVSTKRAIAAKKPSAPTLPTTATVLVVDGTHKPKPRQKLVRDSFTMPRSDFDLIALLKERALMFRRPTKKSELLRAGLQALAGLNQQQLQEALDSLPLLKSSRPKKLPAASKALGVE